MSSQTLAILFMLSGIFCFSIMDVFAKNLTPSIGLIPTLWARYAGQSLLVILLVSRKPNVWKARHPYLQALRSVLLLSATGFFFAGFVYMGLASATALMMLNPVLITLGGALILREGIGLQRIIGIALSVTGAMIIIRPGGDVFTPAMLLPIMGAVCYAAYSIATRFVGQNESVWTSLLYTGLFGGALTTLALPIYWQTPATTDLAMMFGIATAGTLGQLLVIQAFTRSEAGAIAPFGYVGLVNATILGVLFFGDFPDKWTLLGSLVITLAGIYVWHRENKAKRNQA